MEGVISFKNIPAIVATFDNNIDFFPGVLADIGQP